MASPVIIDIKANSQNAQTAIDKVNQGLNKTGQEATNVSNLSESGAEKMGAGFAKAAAKIYAAYAAIKVVIGGFFENQQAGVRLNAVLKATGGEAGITSSKMKELTKSLQDYTGQGIADVKNAQAVLLTFKKIGVDSFDRAQKAAADLSAVLQQDMKSSVLQLGKALEDPIRGITALRRAGVSFTEAEKKQIAQLQNSNRLYEAQAMVLKAIETQVGGTAKAMNDSDAGGFSTAMNALKDALAAIGSLFAPVIRIVTKVLQGVADIINFLVKEAPAALYVIGIAIAAAFGPVTAGIAIVVGLISLFSDTTKSVEDLNKSVDESKRVMDKLDAAQKNFNKSADDTIKKLSGLQQGSAAYKNEIQALLDKYPELVAEGISVSSSIDDIRKAQAAVNQAMKDKAMLQAAKEFDKLKENVEDATTQLARAQKAYEKDPTEQNRAALNSAAKMYMGLRREIERTGKLSGKSHKEISDAVKNFSFDALVAWDGNLKKMENAMSNTASLIQKTWSEMLNGMSKDQLKFEKKMLETNLRTSKGATDSYIKEMRKRWTQQLKDVNVKLAQVNRQTAPTNLRGGGSLTDLSGKIEDATFKNEITNLDKYSQKRLEIMYKLEKEEVKLINDTSVTKEQRIALVDQLRIKAQNDIFNLERQQQDEIQKQKEQDIKAEEQARKKLAQDVQSGLSTANSIVQTLTDSSKATEERIFDAGTQLAKQFGPTGQAVAAGLELGKTIFKAFKKNHETWAQKFEKRLKKVAETYKKQLENIQAEMMVSGEFNVELLQAKLNVATKQFNDLFRDQLDNMLGMTQEEMIKHIKTLGDVQLQGAVDVMQQLREARIALQSAFANQAKAEIEHNNAMGKYQNNELQYYNEKISVYNDIIDAIRDELKTGGENYTLQKELWSVEEERYTAQKAINDAKREEIGLAQTLNNITGASGFAAHYRNRLAGELASSGLSMPSLSNTPSVVRLGQGSAGNTTNYIVNGVSFLSPSDMVMNLNNQKFYQTGRSLF